MEDARMAESDKTKKIMTKPLPQILDEIEDSIGLADEAAKNARDAAVEARKAGDKAFSEATKVANERIDKVEQIAKNALQLAELLKLAVMDGVATVDKRLKEKAPKDFKVVWRRKKRRTLDKTSRFYREEKLYMYKGSKKLKKTKKHNKKSNKRTRKNKK